MAQVVKHLPAFTLSSNHNIAKKTKNKKNQTSKKL
jgi:hypothetical protein